MFIYFLYTHIFFVFVSVLVFWRIALNNALVRTLFSEMAALIALETAEGLAGPPGVSHALRGPSPPGQELGDGHLEV